MAHTEKCRGCMNENKCDYITCRIEHDADIRAKAIEEFAERLKENYQSHAIDICLRQNDYYSYSNACHTLESYIDEIAEEMRGAE